ncbi:hypothetical protein N3K66_008607 [Trichothecium roseum]|uniref:Uncharacterized protein n=1 Tax=Trichothecium roseum TaxID=47278 RepID=A0ACC0UQP3_9HYPO|nr:hypothetical protein N3K66_008607 [Trichothecium roseum]
MKLSSGFYNCLRANFLRRRLTSRSNSILSSGAASRRGTGTDAMAGAADDYASWSKENLIEKLRETEGQLRARQSAQPVAAAAAAAGPAAKRKQQKRIDPSMYSTRHIALKFAYLGKNYGGLEYADSGVLPSIESELWKALTKACLVFPPAGQDPDAVDFSCCDYSKCGRTDRGVSAFGQVVALRVRSSRPTEERRRRAQEKERARLEKEGKGGEAATQAGKQKQGQAEEEEEKEWDPIADELCYPRLLNKILPKDIRVLAWCPAPSPDFSARFSCVERRYRYFFTQPAVLPLPARDSGDYQQQQQQPAAWLDLDAMRDAAARFEGEHDFRNFCKVDAGKAMTDFRRKILSATIEEVPHAESPLPVVSQSAGAAEGGGGGPHPKVYCFYVRGTAFLWHQIRHMVAVLFLVAQGLEAPEVVTRLLDHGAEPRKPVYNMADDAPLVLWDCVFRGGGEEGGLDWIYADDDGSTVGLLQSSWALWRERKMDEVLSTGFMNVASGRDPSARLQADKKGGGGTGAASFRVFEGGDAARSVGKYTPLMKRARMETVEEQNDKYAKRKGFADAEDMRRQRTAKWEEENGGGGDE